MVCSTLLSSSLCVKKQKKLYQTDQGALVAGSSNVCKVATTSTDDDEEYFEPSKRPEITHTATTDILLLTIESDDIMPCPHTNRHLILVFVFIDPVQISELLAKTIGDAHSRTCLFSGEHIADMLRKPQDISKVHYYKNMVSRSSLWSPIQKLSTKRFSIHFFPNSFISFNFCFILGID